MWKLAVRGCLLICAAEGSHRIHWQYNDTTEPSDGKCHGTGSSSGPRCGPSWWKVGKHFEKCGQVGTQSPINCAFSDAPALSGTWNTDLVLKPGVCGSAYFFSNPYTVRVEPAKDCGSSYTATWKGTDYVLKYFQYHAPSEHTVDGMYYPLEAHHVHESGDHDYLIIAVFATTSPKLASPAMCGNLVTDECKKARFFHSILTLGRSDVQNGAPTFAGALATLRAAKPRGDDEVPDDDHHHRDQQVSGTVVNHDSYSNFIAPIPSQFYFYTGSFTTPPCDTDVSWIILPDPVLIFQESLSNYRTLINARPGNNLNVLALANTFAWKPNPPPAWDSSLGNNNRPLQQGGSTNQLYKIGNLPEKKFGGHKPKDSSASSSGVGQSRSSGSDVGKSLGSSQSSSLSSESDSLGSYDSSGSNDSGSSGFFMALWKWLLLALLALCCLAALMAAFCCHKKSKKVVKKRQHPAHHIPPTGADANPYKPEHEPLMRHRDDPEVVLVTDVEPLLMPVPNMLPAVSVPFPMAQPVPTAPVVQSVPATTTVATPMTEYITGYVPTYSVPAQPAPPTTFVLREIDYVTPVSRVTPRQYYQ